eukprot:CAMPEP_0183307822 /NCGR_PEP_ID=MMETSP0160_2-20130417/19563_1 /TAXON_ID=2839 ORGANISM="Odontella Sinensis, Strain Grunow 1884" /NCGR_SAMPLE_ID=MMETSP0160_2 /ASSEMBLY_ACC=CAM_ASM_000250 /LENGTH=511 /DNA_ID=CAMNT_0025471501 /DNA_START=81 /DNA_END=1616 /DNA_ORIENTATION=-
MSKTSTVTEGYDSCGSVFTDEMGAGSDQLFFVTSYTDHDKLAHGPRGKEASHSVSVYRFHPSDGSMVLLNKTGDPNEVMNPAFTRFHPRLNVVYTCTEDVEDNGQIISYAMSPDGEMKIMGKVDAGGTSTCYLTIDRAQKHLLAVNYWDSTLAVFPISQESGELTGTMNSIYDPKGGRAMVAAAKKNGGVNHSLNDDSTISMRQKDPHSHALVLDPYVGCVAYVPDLGKDLIREFYYDKRGGKVETELHVLPSGLSTGKPDGPRYFEFHPSYNVAYVVNELSSTIAVFSVDRELLYEVDRAAKNNENMERFKGRSTLRLIQSIRTIPTAFPTKMNTCGRICVHKSGRFVIVSNRGHESIAIFRVNHKAGMKGGLNAVGYFHTRGETPRHFQFDASGQWLVVANQDSDTIAVFTFNLSSGEIKYSGNEYRVPSPNFVCCCPMHDDEEEKPISDDEIFLPGPVVDSVPKSNDRSIPDGRKSDSKEELEAELLGAQQEIKALKVQIAALSGLAA